MADIDLPLDDKAKRMRDLLSSFYSADPSMPANTTSAKSSSLDAINTPSFDPDHYMNLLIQKSNLEGLLQRHVEMAAEIKNLDTDLQMLVYENYNKFISATDTIKRMKNNIVGMEVNMEQLLDKIISVQSRSDRVNTSLSEKREHIEKLHRTRNLLRKVQFIYDLPTRLGKCIKSEAYSDAVRFFTGAMPIFKVYGDSSFQDCKRASEEAMAIIIKNLQEKLFSDSEPTEARAEAVVLLKQLDFPVDSLKAKLLGKLEHFLEELQLESRELETVSLDSDEPSQLGKFSDPIPSMPLEASAKKVSIHEFAEALHAYQVIFPDSENQLIELARNLFTRHFETIQQHIKKKISLAYLLGMLPSYLNPNLQYQDARLGYDVEMLDALRRVINRMEPDTIRAAAAVDEIKIFREGSQGFVYRLTIHSRGKTKPGVIWTDVTVMDEVLPEAALPDFSFQAVHGAIKQYITSMFSYLLHDVSESLTRVQPRANEGLEKACSLQVTLESSKQAVIQGSIDVLLDFRRLLDDNLGLLLKLRDLIIDWVQEGFQEFFRALDVHFLSLSGRNISTSQEEGSVDGIQGDKVVAGLVLVLAQLSVFIEQRAIPRITEEIAASFSGGGVRGYEHGPAFVPGEICRIFRSAGEKFLHLYINMKTQKISVLLRKRFMTPNWIKHKEPREVHMFVDLFLQELEGIGSEVKQILPQGINRKHRRSDSNGSTTSSRSNPMREDKMNRSNTQRARSQLLETHLAKLFKQKMEIFTKVDYTQESVISTVVKLCLKSFQEFVRPQTFNRSGFQQIQLDIQFLRSPLKEIVEDEAAVDFLLDEVVVAAAERCLDPIPLEPAILDKLIQSKLARSKEQNTSS